MGIREDGGPLGPEDLELLDRRIDADIGRSPVFARRRDHALVALCEALSAFPYAAASKTWESGTFADFSEMLRQMLDAFDFAVEWAYRFCTTAPDGTNHDDPALAREARQVMSDAREYSMVWEMMSMARRGRAAVHRTGPDTFLFRKLGQAVPDGELVDRLVNPPEVPGQWMSSAQGLVDMLPELDGIDTKERVNGSRVYSVTPRAFEKVREAFARAFEPNWQLDAGWNLGGYTVGEYRQFYTTLLALCWYRQQLPLSVPDGITRIGFRPEVLPRDKWLARLCAFGGFNRDVAEAILNDISYDPNLYGPTKKRLSVVHQPFLPVSGGALALCEAVPLWSNHERNMWDLLSVIRPKLHSELRNRKEEVWLASLTELARQWHLYIGGPVQLRESGRTAGDIDALILDSEDRFGTVTELKWLTAVNRMSDVVSSEHELQKGIREAEKAIAWVRSDSGRMDVERKLSIDLAGFELRPLVLSKNTMGSGWLDTRSVPVASERLLEWVLGAPHHRKLRTFWDAINEKRYMPREGHHYKSTNMLLTFGGINLVGKNMGARMLRPWDPRIDIRLKGLV